MTTEKNNRANTSLMEGTNLTEEGKSREGEAKLSEEMRKMRNEELYSFADASVGQFGQGLPSLLTVADNVAVGHRLPCCHGAAHTWFACLVDDMSAVLL